MGVHRWVRKLGAASVAVVIGATALAVAPVDAAPFGWTQQFGTPAGESVTDIVTLSNGDVCVAGYTAGTLPGLLDNTSGNDGFLVRYDKAGNELWRRQLGGEANVGWQGVAAMGSDCVVGGWVSGDFGLGESVDGFDSLLGRYDRKGNLKFVKRFAGPGWNFIDGVAATSSAIAISGYTAGDLGDGFQGGANDGFVARLDKNGKLTWLRDIGTSADEEAWGVDINSAGEIFAVGKSNGTFTGKTATVGVDGFVAKYDKKGNRLWLETLSNTGNQNLEARGVVATDKGGVIVGASTQGTILGHVSSGSWDLVARRYDKNGVELWSQQIGTNADDYGFQLAVTKKGILYFSAYTTGSWSGFTNQGSRDQLLVRLNASTGDKLLHRQWGTSLDDGDSAYGQPVALGANGTVIVGSYTTGTFMGFSKAGGVGDADCTVTQIAL